MRNQAFAFIKPHAIQSQAIATTLGDIFEDAEVSVSFTRRVTGPELARSGVVDRHFGSVARGDADSDSDVDVLIVVDDLGSPGLHERVGQLHADVRSWTGNDLQVVEHSQESWRKLIRAKNPLVEQVRLHGVALTAHTVALRDRH